MTAALEIAAAVAAGLAVAGRWVFVEVKMRRLQRLVEHNENMKRWRLGQSAEDAARQTP